MSISYKEIIYPRTYNVTADGTKYTVNDDSTEKSCPILIYIGNIDIDTGETVQTDFDKDPIEIIKSDWITYNTPETIDEYALLICFSFTANESVNTRTYKIKLKYNPDSEASNIIINLKAGKEITKVDLYFINQYYKNGNVNYLRFESDGNSFICTQAAAEKLIEYNSDDINQNLWVIGEGYIQYDGINVTYYITKNITPPLGNLEYLTFAYFGASKKIIEIFPNYTGNDKDSVLIGNRTLTLNINPPILDYSNNNFTTTTLFTNGKLNTLNSYVYFYLADSYDGYNTDTPDEIIHGARKIFMSRSFNIISDNANIYITAVPESN